MANHTLLQLRNDAGLTQRETAELLGVSRPTYNLWETGKLRAPERQMNKALLALLPLGDAIVAARGVMAQRTPAAMAPKPKPTPKPAPKPAIDYDFPEQDHTLYDADGVYSPCPGRWCLVEDIRVGGGARQAAFKTREDALTYRHYLAAWYAAYAAPQAARDEGIAIMSAAAKAPGATNSDGLRAFIAWWQAYQAGGGLV